MERLFIFPMDMRYMTKTKGFALVELLVVMMIIASLSVVSLSFYVQPDYEYLHMANKLVELSSDCLINKKNAELTGFYSHYPIRFNSNGNINMAQTVEFDGHNVVIHLGNGYFTIDED